MDQEYYDILTTYLGTSKFPDNYSKNEKDCLRRRSKSFFIKDGLLYHRDSRNNVDQQVQPKFHSHCSIRSQ